MTSEPPDLDEEISFAVDDGAQAGPFSMREIIDSVKSGQRAPSTLVWWAGETDWVPFDSIPGLLSHTIPPPPMMEPAVVEEVATPFAMDTDDAPAESQQEIAEQIIDTDLASDAVEVESPSPHDHVVDEASPADSGIETVRWDGVDEGTIGGAMFGSPTPADAGSIAGGEDLVQGAPEGFGSTVDDSHHPGDDLIEEIIPANAGVFDTSVDPIEEEPFESVVAEAGSRMPDVFGEVADLPVEESGTEFWSETRMPDIEPAEARSDFDAETPAEQILEQIDERSPLESVGERIEALGADTFVSDYQQPHALPVTEQPGLDDLDTSFLSEPPAAELVDSTADFGTDAADIDSHDPPPPTGSPLPAQKEFDEPMDVAAAVESNLTDTGVDTGFLPYDEEADFAEPFESVDAQRVEPAMAAVPVSPEADIAEMPAASSAAPVAAMPTVAEPSGDALVADDEELEAEFAEMVTSSWAHFKRVEWATRLDDVMLGGLITSTLDNGYALIDLTSTGTNHFVRFEHPTDGSRITMGIEHLTPSATEGEVLGHHASVVIGWGNRVADASTALQAVKEEMKGNIIQTPEPGTVTVDADLTSGYAYTQIDLIWAIEDYVARDYSVDHARLSRSVDAAVHSLRKYWYGRFVPASK